MTHPAFFETLVLATHNEGKCREFAALLDGVAGTVITAGSLKIPEPEETGKTFEENALLKARAVYAACEGKFPALADDSGLCVTLLDDAPGVYSARWAGPQRDFRFAMEQVWEKLREKCGQDALDKTPPRAAFVTILALVLPGGEVRTFEGRIDGTLCWPSRGEGGFGYDPIFIPDGQDRTFAEMSLVEKQIMSHRARAVQKLSAFFQKAEG